MNEIKFEGRVLHSDIVFLPGYHDVSVCHIVVQNNSLACMPVFCFGKMAIGVKKEIKDNDIIYVSGKIITYVFHDNFDTVKNMAMIFAKEIKIDKNKTMFLNLDYEEGAEKACFEAMCRDNFLPVPEEDYELIASTLDELSW
ncbi:MAG: hypothetical protein HFH73_02655 [Lachnospiraceae bacterium]|nr:hypothetical protein [Lachnospiraceae bacterium]